MKIGHIKNETKARLAFLFQESDRELVEKLHTEEYSNNISFLEMRPLISLSDSISLSSKLSNVNASRFKDAIEMAKGDWRDTFVAGWFAND